MSKPKLFMATVNLGLYPAGSGSEAHSIIVETYGPPIPFKVDSETPNQLDPESEEYQAAVEEIKRKFEHRKEETLYLIVKIDLLMNLERVMI